MSATLLMLHRLASTAFHAERGWFDNASTCDPISDDLENAQA
jgi:hypothetical protein